MHGEMSRYAWISTTHEKQTAIQHIARVQNRLKRLTPAGRRLLSLLLNAYNVNYGASISRKQIAALLGRPSGGLTPHDRRLLTQLCEFGLLQCKRETIRTMENRPCGAEFRYSMDEDTAWILNQLRQKNRKKQLKAG